MQGRETDWKGRDKGGFAQVSGQLENGEFYSTGLPKIGQRCNDLFLSIQYKGKKVNWQGSQYFRLLRVVDFRLLFQFLRGLDICLPTKK